MWTKKIPEVDGWYWMKYKGKNGMVKCPCQIIHIMDCVLANSARNDRFIAGPSHGGPELRYKGKIDKSIRFGDNIPEQAD